MSNPYGSATPPHLTSAVNTGSPAERLCRAEKESTTLGFAAVLKNLSPAQAAAKCLMTEQRFGHVASGLSTPMASETDRITKVLGVDAELIGKPLTRETEAKIVHGC